MSRGQPINVSQVGEKLSEIAAACARLRNALQNHRPLESDASSNRSLRDANAIAPDSAELLPSLMEME
jgi:hypothetical protein